MTMLTTHDETLREEECDIKLNSSTSPHIIKNALYDEVCTGAGCFIESVSDSDHFNSGAIGATLNYVLLNIFSEEIDYVDLLVGSLKRGGLSIIAHMIVTTLTHEALLAYHNFMKLL